MAGQLLLYPEGEGEEAPWLHWLPFKGIAPWLPLREYKGGAIRPLKAILGYFGGLSGYYKASGGLIKPL